MRRTMRRLAVVAVGTTGLVGLLAASAGAQEATTAKTPKAKTRVTLVEQQFLLPGLTPDEADSVAVCPERTTLLSGGALSNTSVITPTMSTEIYKSGPSGNSWFVRYDNDTNVNLQPSVQAICLKNRLKVKGADGKAKAISKVTQVNTAFTLPPSVAPTNGHAQLDVPCPEGTTIAGGGASFAATTTGTDIRLQESGPQDNGWHVRYDVDDQTVAQTGIASALCLKNKLKVKGDEGKDKARSKFEQVDLGVTLPPRTTNEGRARFTVSCQEGTSIVGGGGKISPAAPLATTDIHLEESGAQDNGWQVTFDNVEDVAQSATVHALCLKNKLKVK